MKFLIKLKLLFNYIVFSKYVFKFPSKKKILIYDNNNVHFLKKFFSFSDVNILHARGEEFNIIIILKNFLKLKFSKREYYNSYIKHVDPKILITFSDNDQTFFQLDKFLAKKIIIQNAWKTEQDDHIFRNMKFKRKKFNFNLDYVLVFNKHFGEKYKTLTGCRYIKIGSFKSNLVPIIKKKKYDILYISSWNDVDPNRKIAPNLNWEKFNLSQTFVIKYLFNYSKKNKKSLFVYGKMTNPEKAKKEYYYYRNILGEKNWKFIFANRKKSYNIIDKAKLNVTLNSSLGYESFSRGTKTIFFSLRPKKKYLNSLRFAWPAKFKGRGFFWTDTLNVQYCDRMFNRVIRLDQAKWRKIKSNFQEDLMNINENNSKFSLLIKRIFNEHKSL